MPENFSIVQIREWLQQKQVPSELLDTLYRDERIGVRKLLLAYEKRQNKLKLEEKRIQKLYDYEQSYYRQKVTLVAGVDEAGRGPLAGPVVVGAAILPPGCFLAGLNDSKQLSAKRREELYQEIKEKALACATHFVPPAEIDSLNIYQATLAGMYTCLRALSPAPEVVLSDAVPLRALSVPWQELIGGDALSASIAAASILAKVERDRLMQQYHVLYPQYGFERNKGYGTAEHLAALKRWGPCPIHRCSFEPVKSMV